MSFVAVTPTTHQPYAEAADDFEALAVSGSASYRYTDSLDGLEGADAVYTDTWVSMGQEEEVEHRRKAFVTYQVNAQLMEAAPSSARFMHDLPAKRGLEVTDDVIDGSRSIVFEQAKNRMHLARGLFAWLLAR